MSRSLIKLGLISLLYAFILFPKVYSQDAVKCTLSNVHSNGKINFAGFNPTNSLVTKNDSAIYIVRNSVKGGAEGIYVFEHSLINGEFITMRCLFPGIKDPSLQFSGVNKELNLVLLEKYDPASKIKTIYFQKLDEKLNVTGNLQPLVKISQEKEIPGIPLFTKGVFIPDIFFHYLPLANGKIDTGFFTCYILREDLVLKDSFQYKLPPKIKFNTPLNDWMKPYEYGFYFFAQEKIKNNRSEYKFYYVNTGSKLVEIIRSDDPVALTSPVFYTGDDFAGIIDHTIGWGEDTADIRLIHAKNESLWIWDKTDVILDPAYRRNMVNNTMEKESVKNKMAPVVTHSMYRTAAGNMFVVGIQTPFYPGTDTLTKSTVPVTHYGTVLVTLLNPDGKELWTRCIEKVPVEESEPHSGFRCFIKNEELQLFFFGNSTNYFPDSTARQPNQPEKNSPPLSLIHMSIPRNGKTTAETIWQNDNKSLNILLPELVFINNEPVLIGFLQDKKNTERMMYLR